MSALQSDDEVVPSLLPPIAGLFTFAALAGAGFLATESAVAAVVAGALSGSGTYLMLPYFIRRAAVQNGELSEDDLGGEENLARGGLHPGAAGYAFSTAGMVVIALMFVFEDPLIAIPAGVALPVLEYAVLSRVLPR